LTKSGWGSKLGCEHAVNTSLYAPPPHPCGGGFKTELATPL